MTGRFVPYPMFRSLCVFVLIGSALLAGVISVPVFAGETDTDVGVGESGRQSSEDTLREDHGRRNDDAISIIPAISTSDPLENNFTGVRADHSSTVLDDGRILIVGGVGPDDRQLRR